MREVFNEVCPTMRDKVKLVLGAIGGAVGFYVFTVLFIIVFG